MRRIFTALLVSAALAGTSGAYAQGWNNRHQGDGNNANDNNGSQGSQGGSGQGGSGQGGSGQGGSGQGGSHHDHGGSGGNGAQSQSQSSGGGGGSTWHHGQGGSQDQQQMQVQSAGGGNGGNWDHNKGGNGDRRDHNWNQGNGQGNNWQGRGDHDNGQWQGNRHGGNWNNNWRNDRHWNWQVLRNRDRGRFHLPAYRAPNGYRYHRFYRGSRLARFLFASEFWFNATDFGLPPAYGPYRWVRYYNDALLVNIYTGEVVDVIPDFFW